MRDLTFVIIFRKDELMQVTRYELCMKTGFRDRQVRDLIHYARRDGSILNLSDGKDISDMIWMDGGKRNACSICQAGMKAEEIP